MNLSLPTEGLDSYKSLSQRARIGTESWGAANFFCPVCSGAKRTHSCDVGEKKPLELLVVGNIQKDFSARLS